MFELLDFTVNEEGFSRLLGLQRSRTTHHHKDDNEARSAESPEARSAESVPERQRACLNVSESYTTPPRPPLFRERK